MKNSIIKITSVFPARKELIWKKLQNINTLKYIAKPYAAFNQIENEEINWEMGKEFKFNLKIFGFIPMGIHTIKVNDFNYDDLIIQTYESNKMVPIWNHRIELFPIDNENTQYTDIIELNAGIFTKIVKLWSKLFYTHRQRKWLEILNNN